MVYELIKIKNTTEEEARSIVTLLEIGLINQFYPICNHRSKNTELSSPKVEDIKEYIRYFKTADDDSTEANFILPKGGMV